jgi:hypothetical protein
MHHHHHARSRHAKKAMDAATRASPKRAPHLFKLNASSPYYRMLNSIRRLRSCIYHEDSAIDMLALGGPIVSCTWD